MKGRIIMVTIRWKWKEDSDLAPPRHVLVFNGQADETVDTVMRNGEIKFLSVKPHVRFSDFLSKG
jgi:hypothetical protein